MDYTLDEIDEIFEPLNRRDSRLVSIFFLVLAAHILIVCLWPYEEKRPMATLKLEVSLHPVKEAGRRPAGETRSESIDKSAVLQEEDFSAKSLSDKKPGPARRNDLADRVFSQIRRMAIDTGLSADHDSRLGKLMEREGGHVGSFNSEINSSYQVAPNGLGVEKIGGYCYQQRGDLNDPSTWRWYRVRSYLCGHL